MEHFLNSSRTPLTNLQDGEPLSQWHLRATPNTFTSICTTAIRVALGWLLVQTLGQQKWHHFYQDARPLYDMQAFEECCRGPDGAFKLLRRCRGSKMAAAGAFLSLLLLTIDPFGQQLLIYPTVQKATSIEMLQRVVHYSVTPGHMSKILQLSDGTLQTAIISAMTPNPMEVRPHCPTGNCESTPFTSVAFCSQCRTGIGHRVGKQFTSPSNVSWTNPGDGYPDQENFVFSNWSEIAGVKRPLFGLARPVDASYEPSVYEEDIEFNECALAFCTQRYELSVASGDVKLSALNHTWMDSTSLHNDGYSVSLSTFNDIANYFAKSLTSDTNPLRAQFTGVDDDAFISRLAITMSQALLRSTASVTVPVTGTVFDSITIIHVRWLWLILPIGLVFATIILFMSVMHQSSVFQVPLWRASILALLAAQIEPSLDGHEMPDQQSVSTFDPDLEQGLGIGLQQFQSPEEARSPSPGHANRQFTFKSTISHASVVHDPNSPATWLKDKFQLQRHARQLHITLVSEEGRWFFRTVSKTDKYRPQGGPQRRNPSVSSKASSAAVQRPLSAHLTPRHVALSRRS